MAFPGDWSRSQKLANQATSCNLPAAAWTIQFACSTLQSTANRRYKYYYMLYHVSQAEQDGENDNLQGYLREIKKLV